MHIILHWDGTFFWASLCPEYYTFIKNLFRGLPHGNSFICLAMTRIRMRRNLFGSFQRDFCVVVEAYFSIFIISRGLSSIFLRLFYDYPNNSNISFFIFKYDFFLFGMNSELKLKHKYPHC